MLNRTFQDRAPTVEIRSGEARLDGGVDWTRQEYFQNKNRIYDGDVEQLNKTFSSSAFPATLAGDHPHWINFKFVAAQSVFNVAGKKGQKYQELLGPLTDVPKNAATTASGSQGSLGTLGKAATSAVNDNLGSALSGAISRYGSAHSIGLLMPNNILIPGNALWHPIDADPTILGLLLRQGGGALQRGAGLVDYAKEVLTSLGLEFAQGAGGVLNEGPDKGLMQALTMSLENPFTDMAFATMARRHFRFEWQLFPRNSGEMKIIKDIIQRFRFHMHPSLNDSTGGAFLDFPSYVVPEFMFKRSPSPALPKVGLCVINNVDANMTPGSHWVTYTDGEAVQINFAIEISETQPLLKEDIAAGY